MRSTDLFSIYLPEQLIILRWRSTSPLSILRANFLLLIRGQSFKFNRCSPLLGVRLGLRLEPPAGSGEYSYFWNRAGGSTVGKWCGAIQDLGPGSTSFFAIMDPNGMCLAFSANIADHNSRRMVK